MNKTFDMKTLIVNNNLLGDKDMFMAYDWSMLNTGVWLLRNSEFSLTFLKAIYEAEPDVINHGNWEQTSLINLLENNVLNAKDHLATAHYKGVNSYQPIYTWGDFILHFCGCRGLNLLKDVVPAHSPLKLFGESQESYDDRIRWLKERYK
jgi:hypothetical protein